MADLPAADILHDMRESEKRTELGQSTHREDTESPDSNEKTYKDVERTASHGQGYELSHLPIDEHGEYVVTMKTWMVIIVSWARFTPLPAWRLTPALGAGNFVRSVLLASTVLQHDPGANGSRVRCSGSPRRMVRAGQPLHCAYWSILLTGIGRITSVYTAGGTIAFMVCGANSDLFGRRYFILFGNVLVFVGCIVGATSHSIGQSIAAHVMIGFGAGNCQLAAFALPELLPNKWRHFAVVIADGLIYFDVIVGPVAARIAVTHGDAVSDLPTLISPAFEYKS